MWSWVPGYLAEDKRGQDSLILTEEKGALLQSEF